MSSCSISEHSPKKDYLWSYACGFIAGAGSAVGGILFMILQQDEIGIVAAIVCGTIAAATAIPLARRKINAPRAPLCVLGFFTAPAVTLLAMMS
ncbi:MAG: hypothetical protein PSY14_07230 [bacterium]|nr:hypothetical protein [bacterium]